MNPIQKMTAGAALFAAALGADHTLAEDGGTPQTPPTGAASVVETDPANLPQAVSSFGAAVLDGCLYVFGGHVGKAHDHSAANLTGAFLRAPLAGGLQWEALPGDTPLQGTTLVAAGGHLYRIGGLTMRNATTSEPADMHSTDDVKRYDPGTNAWEPFTPLPKGLSSHDAAVLDGRIYVAGGWTLSGGQDTARWNGDAWVLDTREKDPRWNPLPPPPFKRRALAVVASAGRIHVMGGMDEEENMSVAHDIYDPVKGLWDKGADLPEEGFGLAGCEAGGRVVISSKSGGIHRLAADAGSWTPAATLKTPRFFNRLVASGDDVIAVGGATRAAHTGSTERVTLDGGPATGEAASSTRRTRIESYEIAFDGRARNRQGLFLAGDEVVLFGGNNSAGQHDFEPANFEDECWTINLRTRETARLAPFPFKRQSMLTLLSSGGEPRGLVVGGFGHAGAAGPVSGSGARTWPDLFSYDLGAGRFAELAVKLPMPLTQFGLVEHAGDVWIFGGMDFDPARGAKNQFQIQTKVYRWSRSAGAPGFETVPTELPRPRRAFGAAILDGKYCLVGGMRENFEPVRVCDAYDFKTGEWAGFASPAHPLISPEVVALNGRLYLACGSLFSEVDGFQPNKAVLEFDPATTKWTTLVENLDLVARHSRMYVRDGRLLILATVDQDKSRALRVISIDVR